MAFTRGAPERNVVRLDNLDSMKAVIRWIALPATLVSVCLAMAACSAPTSIAVETYVGTPEAFDSSSNLLNGVPSAAWVRGHEEFVIVTYGPENCAPIPTGMEVVDEHTTEVTFVKAAGGSCSAVLEPTTHRFELPDGIADSGPVELRVLFDFDQDYEYSLTLG